MDNNKDKYSNIDSSNNLNEYISNFELTKNIGFKNIGNTCYMNSFLQILLHIPTFLSTLKKLYQNKIEKDTLIYYLIKLSEYPNNTKSLYKIKEIISKTHPKYGEFTQNDTQNFAIDLIDSIISEIKNEISFSSDSSEQKTDNKLKPEENIMIKKYKIFIENYNKAGEKTFIEDLFLFIDSRIRYKENLIDTKQIRYDIQLHIELTFPMNSIKGKYNLYELLDYKYSNENIKINKEIKKNGTTEEVKEFIYIIYNFFCCGKKKESKKNDDDVNNSENINLLNKSSEIHNICKIVTLPKILIISFDRGIEGKELISSFISFENKLDLINYVDEDLYDINLGTTYTLFAINIREGSAKYSGHCYSYVKVENDWVCFNDNYTQIKEPNFCLNSVAGLYYIKDK